MDKMETPEEFGKRVHREWFIRDNLLSEVMARNIASRDAAIRAECAPKWISVKDRLPEDGQRCLVLKYGFTCPTPYAADFVKRNNQAKPWLFVPIYDEIVSEAEFNIAPSHWMPLPEFPAIMAEPEENV